MPFSKNFWRENTYTLVRKDSTRGLFGLSNARPQSKFGSKLRELLIFCRALLAQKGRQNLNLGSFEGAIFELEKKGLRIERNLKYKKIRDFYALSNGIGLGT